MFFTILIAFFSIITLLILHEFGHFIIAKKFGVKVEEFGVGYPPRLFGRKFGETLYSVNLLPFGAFVKIPGVEGEENKTEHLGGLAEKLAVWKKALVILGGVISFWVVAAILLAVVSGIGTPQAISDEEAGPLVNPKVQILAVSPASPAESAGIRTGDVIIKIQNPETEVQAEINKVKEVQEFTEENKGKEVILTIQRGKEILDVSLVPRISPPEGEGAMGLALVRTAEKSYPWWQCPVKGIEATANLTGAVVLGWGKILGSLIQGEGLPGGVQLLGPIGIGSLVTQAVQVGLSYFLQFIAVISVYLAVFNLLPIPALDGGRLLFLGIEKIKRGPINKKVEQNITTVFFGLLILIMIWVTIKDITRLF
jgi:regulator of sigma E protease